ncbi:MAG: hypothetical protein BGO86_02290 [Chryseobacterium sp. 36-9]|nr:MAG: hypothetical protein BGO86_02290 [Chryseobacterium sp. 36-9]
MRTKLLLLYMLWAGMALGQESGKNIPAKPDKNYVNHSTQFIEYNLKSGKYDKDLKRIKVHTPVVFKITNVNPFVYKIAMTPKDSIVGETGLEKEFLESIAKKEKAKAEEKSAEKEAEINKTINEVQPVEKSEAIGDDKKKDKIIKSVVALQEVEKLQRQNEKLSHLLVKEKEVLEIIKNQIRELKTKDSVVALNEQLNSKNVSVTRLEDSINFKKNKISNLQKDITGKIQEYYQLLDDFTKAYSDFSDKCRFAFKLVRAIKYINAIADDPNLDYDGFLKSGIIGKNEDLLKGIEQVDDYRKSFSELSNAYYKLSVTNHLDEVLEPSGAEKLQAYPKFLKQRADQLNQWLITYKMDDALKQAVWVVSVLKEKQNYEITSAPIQPENDLVEFKVKIEQRNKTLSDKLFKNKEFTYRQTVYGGTRVDFSLGLAAGYYWDAPEYEYNKENKIQTTYKNMLSPSLVGMVTMSYRKTNYIAFGGSAGMGVDVNDGKIQLTNFFIGPSILFGRNQRIFLTAGPSVKNVGKLKSEYSDVPINPHTEDFSSYIRSDYKIGAFVSITYSLTKDTRALIKNLR